MLDTVDFRLTRSEVEGVDFVEDVSPYLNPETFVIHDSGNTRTATGKIGNLSVTISPNSVRVKNGSLCKWMLGDNYQTMTRRDVRHAIERLSDTLHLPMDRATITRLDIGLTMAVEHPVTCYFNHLGTLNYAARLQQPDSLYYHLGHARCLCFYDKNKEQRTNGQPVPDPYRGGYVLRYELRYKTRLPRRLGVPAVTGALLYDETFYASMLNRWHEAYRSIRKTNDITLNFQTMMTKRDMQRMGILMLIEHWGGEVEVIAKIKEAQKCGDLSTKQATSLIETIKETCKAREGMTMPNEIITELDKKIAEAVRRYL